MSMLPEQSFSFPVERLLCWFRMPHDDCVKPAPGSLGDYNVVEETVSGNGAYNSGDVTGKAQWL